MRFIADAIPEKKPVENINRWMVEQGLEYQTVCNLVVKVDSELNYQLLIATASFWELMTQVADSVSKVFLQVRAKSLTKNLLKSVPSILKSSHLSLLLSICSEVVMGKRFDRYHMPGELWNRTEVS